MQNNLFNRIKSTINTGFGTDASVEGDRLINENGKFNVKKKGLPFLKQFSLYQWLISAHWSTFTVLVGVFYILVNSIFASVYFYLGVEHIGVTELTGFDAWMKAFHFSAQTMTTVGYGSMSPDGNATLMVASFEALLGLASFALMTGLVYGRFSKPRHRFIFSDNAILAPFQEGKAFMFRVSNARNSEMTEPEVKVTLSMLVEENGLKKRKFFRLRLQFDKTVFLPMSWTVVHPIDEESPFQMFSLEELNQSKAEILIMIKGFEDTYMQQVHAQKSYVCSDIVKNARFRSMYAAKGQESTVLDYNKFNAIEKLDA